MRSGIKEEKKKAEEKQDRFRKQQHAEKIR